MASIYDIKPEQLFEVPADDQVTRCKMCLEVGKPEDGINLGPLYEYGHPVPHDPNNPDSREGDFEVYCAHYFCLLFSSGLEQNGDTEEVGLKGFLPADVLKEWRRGQRLKCFDCNKSYASVGCSAKNCRKTFHLPCAIR